MAAAFARLWITSRRSLLAKRSGRINSLADGLRKVFRRCCGRRSCIIQTPGIRKWRGNWPAKLRQIEGHSFIRGRAEARHFRNSLVRLSADRQSQRKLHGYCLERTSSCHRVHFRGAWSVGNGLRSEERRVGKECKSRWSPY